MEKELSVPPSDTLGKILATTEDILLKQGVSELRVRTLCAAAGISRGTFYRYFSSKEELLEAFARYERERFDRMVGERTEHCITPRERIEGYLESIEDYLTAANARRFLDVEPDFVIAHFKSFFPQSVKRTMDVLGPAFDTWDEQLGTALDREFIAELFVRYMLSDVWVANERGPGAFLDRLMAQVVLIAKLVK